MNKIYQRLKHSFSKKALIFCLFSILTIPLSSCWDKNELNELAIITAAAIDKSDDGQVEFTLEIFIPKNAGRNEEDGGSQNESFIISHKGSNLADALSKIQSELPRKDFWGVCKVFIFSDEIAKDGIQNHLDYLLRHSQIRESAYVFVGKGLAKKLIEKKSELERFSAIAINNKTSTGSGLSITLKDLDEMVMDETQSSALPYLTLKEIQTGEDKISEYPLHNGAAMFNEDKMVGTLSDSTARGLLWFRDELEDYTINLKPENETGVISLYPETTKVKLIPKIIGEEWKMIVKVNTEGTIVQNETTLNADDVNSLQLIEETYRTSIEEVLKETLEESQKLKVDALHFGREFHREYPQEWKEVKNNWEESFSEIKVEFVIQANIIRQGYINHSEKMETR